MALSAPATLVSTPLDLPWTLTGGRGILGLGPIRGAIVVWGGLMVFTVAFVMLSALITRWSWRRRRRADAKARAANVQQHGRSPAERARLRSDASELLRQAAFTAAAAKRSRAAAAEAVTKSDEAKQAREAAWAEFTGAQQAYETALDEVTAHLEQISGADADKRAVTTAALAAFKRGDISVDQLRTVFKASAGWDPMQELKAREVELRRSAESRAGRQHQAAVEAERAAVQAAELAAVSAQALAEEAVALAVEAQTVRDELDAAVSVDEPVVKRGKKVKKGKKSAQPIARPAARRAPAALDLEEVLPGWASGATREIPLQRAGDREVSPV